ncbi:MAG: glycerate-2-kinase family protein [Myxococcota bacterium]|nr:glycerate-2-kinase family protein [Myxococcota bacterium]
MLRAGVEAVLPERCLPAALRCLPDGEGLIIEAADVREGAPSGPAARAHLAPGAKIWLLCLGKCALGSALWRLLGEHIGRALVVDQAPQLGGVAVPAPAALEVLVGDHPLAGERGLAAGGRVRDLVSAAMPGELLIACLSGGASALVDLPARGVPAEWLASVPAALMHGGVDVRDLLGVRAAPSALPCGGLLERLPPGVAPLVLVLSDGSGDEPAEAAGAPFWFAVLVLVLSIRSCPPRPATASTGCWSSTAICCPRRHAPGSRRSNDVVCAPGTPSQRPMGWWPPTPWPAGAAGACAARRGLQSEDRGECSGTPAEVAAALCAWAAARRWA